MSVALASGHGAKRATHPSTILFLAANPVRVRALQLGEECRAIEDKIRAAEFRAQIRFRSRWAARPDDLLQVLNEDSPSVLHFSGHGAGSQGLCFQSDDGSELSVSADGLAKVIQSAGACVTVVVLNACYSEVQAQALIAHVPCIIGMSNAIRDEEAIIYAASFYSALAFGKSVANAHQQGIAALALHPTSGQTRDIEPVEADLCAPAFKLLSQPGIDANCVYIVNEPIVKARCVLVIKATLREFNADVLARVTQELRQLTGDLHLEITDIEEGSVRLGLSLSPVAIRKLVAIVENGQITRICGFDISSILESRTVETDAATAVDVTPTMAVGRKPSTIDAQYPALANATGSAIFTSMQQWICAVHVDLIGQLPDRRALVRWIAVRHDSHREIARDLLQSEDYCRAQASALYRSLLDRDGDSDGVTAWTRALRSGIALQDVIASICDGFEYKANHPDGPAFVESLYQRLLHRGSDPEGRTAALAALQQRSGTLVAIRGFLTSSEYCCQQVTKLHVGLLGREPEPSALSEQSLALMQGTPLQQIVLNLVTSDEYLARAAHRKVELTAHEDELKFDGGPAVLAPARGSDPDADVLALVGRDTRGALHCLMQRHGRAVYRYCRTALGNAVLADDIHQQVFIEAFRDLPGFAGRSTLRTWLFGIARHRVLDAAKRRRQARAHLDVTAGADLPDPRPSPGEELDDAQLEAALVTCLAALDEPIRAAVLLRYQQGLTYEEMAEICGEKAGTLEVRVARALGAQSELRDLLTQERRRVLALQAQLP